MKTGCILMMASMTSCVTLKMLLISVSSFPWLYPLIPRCLVLFSLLLFKAVCFSVALLLKFTNFILYWRRTNLPCSRNKACKMNWRRSTKLRKEIEFETFVSSKRYCPWKSNLNYLRHWNHLRDFGCWNCFNTEPQGNVRFAVVNLSDSHHFYLRGKELFLLPGVIA